MIDQLSKWLQIYRLIVSALRGTQQISGVGWRPGSNHGLPVVQSFNMCSFLSVCACWWKQSSCVQHLFFVSVPSFKRFSIQHFTFTALIQLVTLCRNFAHLEAWNYMFHHLAWVHHWEEPALFSNALWKIIITVQAEHTWTTQQSSKNTEEVSVVKIWHLWGGEAGSHINNWW